MHPRSILLPILSRAPRVLSALALLAVATLTTPAPAGALSAGEPKPWGIGFQQPASLFAERMFVFHDKILLTTAALITVFVLGLLLYVIVRFNERANPVPSRTTHHAKLEVAWTLIPVLVLAFLAIPSFPLLYYGDVVPDAKYTVKITGHQWYWSTEYETPEGETFSFDMLLLDDDEAASVNLPRLLAVDEPMVIPANVPVRFVITSSDVLHSFAVPAFGVKMDAVPGRLNETWAEVTKTGTYYGQCSELCGSGHAYMPLMIHAVEEAEYLKWISESYQRFANLNPENTTRQLAATHHNQNR